MKNAKKITIGLTSVVLAGTLAFGATASASGVSNDDGTYGRKHLTEEQVCAKADEIDARIAKMTERIDTLTAKLQEKRAAAEAAGKTELVARIDKALARLDERGTRIAEKAAKFEAWTAEHCDAT